jgi:hypothetical protein
LQAIPEPLRGRAFVASTLAFTGGEAVGAELVAPLRAVAAGPLASEALIYGVGAATTPETAAAVNATLAAMSDRLAPRVEARRTLLTFDPDGLLVANHIAD